MRKCVPQCWRNGVSRVHDKRLIQAVRVAEHLSPVGDIRATERQLREVAALDEANYGEALITA